MTYEELQNLNPEELAKLQEKNDNHLSVELLLAYTILIKAVFSNGQVLLYIRRAIPVPIEIKTIGHAQLSKDLDNLIVQFLNRIYVIITKGMENSWKIGESQGIAGIRGKVPENFIKKLSDSGLFSHRKDVLDTFVNRKTNGFKLSERVWKLGPQIKMEIESTLQLGLVDGRSAIQMAQDLTRHLKEPDKLFRRIRDAKTGKLKLSKAAQDYNPGRGVYRSSYKNAMRLSRNEVNRAYRAGNLERIQSMPFVTGINISLSGSHPVRMPQADVCDKLKGVYPKDFRWYGWHVMCMCRMTSVLPSESELEAYLLTHGTDNANIPPQIKTYPESVGSWIRENKSRYKPGTVDWIDENKAVLSMMK